MMQCFARLHVNKLQLPREENAQFKDSTTRLGMSDGYVFLDLK